MVLSWKWCKVDTLAMEADKIRQKGHTTKTCTGLKLQQEQPI